jgi:hypothetical protein
MGMGRRSVRTDTERTIAWAYTCARKQQIEDEHTAETIAQGALECATFFLGLGVSAGASAFFSAAGAGAAASVAGAACARESEAFAGGQQAASGASRAGSLTRAPQG